ncbi:MAG: DUF4091 domain-containing protein [Armatimonadetes bacterium]|nr:DUF4091 domain-containing protein [Armatimonadota bacterium]
MSNSTRLLLAILCMVCFSSSSSRAGRLWWDGSRDAEKAAPGKLLSDNEGYWGECVLTGVDYRYETPPDSPADIWKEDRARFGRRLLDGRPSGNWWIPVGLAGRPLTVEFDFKRSCAFSEIDLCTRSRKVSIKAECRANEQDSWRTIFERSRDDSPDRAFHRVPLPDRPWGRHLRLSVEAQGTTYLDEVMVWGDAEISVQTPEALKPTAPTPVVAEIAFQSVTGIAKTAFSDGQFWGWQRGIGTAAKLPAVWSQAPAWDSITDRPLLPSARKVARQVRLTMARNETESLALVLTNTSMVKPVSGEVRLEPFRKIGGGGSVRLKGEIRAGGAIGSRHFGVNIGPLFSADNLPGGSLMLKYLTNGASIKDFPRLTLPPAGSAVLWLSATSEGAKPGLYEARAAFNGSLLKVRAEVLNVTLPRPFVWLQTWSGTTSMFPFVYTDRAAREVRYKQSLGVTVWGGLPVSGSEAALARQTGRTIHHVYGLPSEYVNRGYNNQIKPQDITAKDEQAIAEYIRALVKQAKGLGLTYNDWYGELWDEPGGANSPLYGALAKSIRKTDPKVRIFCNPSFWIGNGCAGDEIIHSVMGGWYKECVDVSVPLHLLLRDRPKSFALFNAPRFVRAFYTVSTQSAKSESAAQVELYRRMAWDAYEKGWNGWGFYSYYAPRGNPWSDFDEDWFENLPDYLMVYPGPRGPIPTRHSEAVREGWEDYRLLSLLRQRGPRAELEAILKAYRAGELPAALRLRALKAAARP